jgi:hypothetical protein
MRVEIRGYDCVRRPAVPYDDVRCPMTMLGDQVCFMTALGDLMLLGDIHSRRVRRVVVRVEVVGEDTIFLMNGCKESLYDGAGRLSVARRHAIARRYPMSPRQARCVESRIGGGRYHFW